MQPAGAAADAAGARRPSAEAEAAEVLRAAGELRARGELDAAQHDDVARLCAAGDAFLLSQLRDALDARARLSLIHI